MPRLPQVSGKVTIKALQRIGFQVISQKGSHVKLVRKIGNVTQKVIVPNHKQIKKGTLRSGILKSIDLNIEEFINLLKK